MRRKSKISSVKLISITAAAIVVVSAAILGAMAINASSASEDDSFAKAQFEQPTVVVDESESEPETGEGELETGKIYSNIFINSVSVGDMTKDEAIAELNKTYALESSSLSLEFRNGDKSWDMPYEYIDAKYGIKEAVEQAYSIGRTGTDDEKNSQVENLKKQPADLPLDFFVNAEKILEFLEQVKTELDVTPVNARMKREGGKFQFTEGVSGYELDLKATCALAEETVKAMKSGTIDVVMNEVKPNYSVEDLKKSTDVIGSFSTKYSLSAGDRNENLKTGSSKINGHMLYPGEVFSTNKMLGDTNYENGYRVATVFLNGKLSTGMGGGVCQISSTLYNAVLFSELNILERRNHSLTVSYVPLGRDATLAGDYIDFKFENSTEYPVYVESYLDKGKVHVKIYGHENRPENRTIEFETVELARYEPQQEVLIPDPTMYVGYEEVVTEAKTGYKAAVYKKVLIDGKVQERTQITTSTYKTVTGERKVGTKPIDENYVPPEGMEVTPPPTEEVTPPPTEEVTPHPAEEETPHPAEEETPPVTLPPAEEETPPVTLPTEWDTDIQMPPVDGVSPDEQWSEEVPQVETDF